MKPRKAEVRTLDPYKTKREAAEFLGVTVWTIDRYMKDRKLPHYKLAGHLVRFRMSDLIRFAEKDRVA